MVPNRVSVIITTHNRIELLPRAIHSVLSQTYDDIECIVVSDKSTDGTNQYCCNLEKIIFIPIPEEESKGGNHARNVGIARASGEYIAFLDDDDYWKNSKIEEQVQLFRQSKNCVLVYCNKEIEDIDFNGNQHTHFVNATMKGDLSNKILTTSGCTTSSCILTKKEYLIRIGGFDEELRFWQDYELTIRLAQLGNFYFVNKPLCIYRYDVRDRNRLTNKYFEWWEAVNYIKNKHNILYKRLNLLEKRQSKLSILQDAKTRAIICGLSDEARNIQKQINILCPHRFFIKKLLGRS